MSSYLGGRQNQKEYYERREQVSKLPSINMGWKCQCYCGGTEYVKYRGRFYCNYCARRVKYPDSKIPSETYTFRERFNQLDKKL